MRPPVPTLPAPGIPALLAVLLALWALGYADSLRLPFVNDDYFFLDEVRGASFARLWTPDNLVSGYYRPWSRELHFWALERGFGPHPAPFRLANLVLYLGIGALYFALVRRLAGVRVAAIATAGAAALAAWGVLLVWPSGAQDLWMLWFALAYLHGWTRNASWSAPALGLALISKESAVVLPLVAATHDLVLERRAPAEVLRRLRASALVIAAWILAHPSLGGRLWPDAAARFDPGYHAPPSWTDATRLLALVNLDRIPAPQGGWAVALALGALTALPLAGFAAWGVASREPEPSRRAAAVRRAPSRALVLFGLIWFATGWLPALLPSLGWRAYFGLFGWLGAWMAVAAWIASRPRLAVALVGAIALLRPAHARTTADDWGAEAYQRNSARIVRALSADLMRLHPAFPPGSRIYVANVPGGISLIARPGYSPALRTWYRDSTLRASFLKDYRPRLAGDAGTDYFFVADSGLRWIELGRAPAISPERLARSALWRTGQTQLATLFAEAGEWGPALEGFLSLASVFPEDHGYAHNVAVCYARLGDTTAAGRWLRRSAALRDGSTEGAGRDR